MNEVAVLKRVRLLLASLVISIGLVACGGGGTSDNPSASQTPPPVAGPTACSARTLTWIVGGQSCSAPAGPAAIGSNVVLQVASSSSAGSASFACSADGNFGSTPLTNPPATCAPPPPTACAARTVTWAANGNQCAALLPQLSIGLTSTVANSVGTLLGTATFQCSAQATVAPAQPPASCTAPSVGALSISQFGEGVIERNNQAVCTSRICTVNLPRSTAVSLVAKPSTGWRFASWYGCSSVSGDTCNVVLENDATVHPTFVRTTPLALRTGTMELTTATMQQLISNDAGTLIFGASATQIATLQPNTLIYSRSGEGLLRRVVSVINLTAGNRFVDTVEASLDELILSGTLFYDGRRDFAASPFSHERPQEFSLPRLEIDLVNSQGRGVTGSLQTSLEPQFALDFDSGGVTEFKFIVNPKITPEFALRLATGSFDRQKTYTLPAKLPAFTVGPLVVIPTAELTGKLEAEASANLELNGRFELGGAYGTHYLRSTGFRGVGSGGLTAQIDPVDPAKLTGKASAQTRWGLAVKLRAYGVAGPSVSVGPFFGVLVDGVLSQQERCLKAKAEVGANITAGGDIKILSKRLGEFEVTLAQYAKEFPLISDKGKCEDTEPPSTPTSLRATPKTPYSAELSWVAGTDNVKITSHDIMRDGAVIGQSGSANYLDVTVQPKTEYCYAVVSRDAAKNLSAQSNTVCVRTTEADTTKPTAPGQLRAAAQSSSSIELTWIAAIDNSPTLTYVISRAGQLLSQSREQAWTDTKLRPATQYCYRVSAMDATGNLSNDSQEACATTLASQAWSMKMKCTGTSRYVVEKDVDIDIGNNQTISLVGQATDYDGGGMAYQVSGNYTRTNGQLDGRIRWTFDRSSNVRVDEFRIGLNTTDTGDVAMNQVQVTGCTSQIRFQRKGSPAASAPEPTSVWRPGSASQESIRGR